MSRTTLKLLAINMGVSAAFVLIALGCAEAYLRLTIPSSSPESIFQSTLETRRYKVMRPNAHIIAWGSEFRTNAEGFRDDQPSIGEKQQDGRRVVVIGDSFTASAGVDFEMVYTSLLERDLRGHLPKTEVVNLAVGGYNIIQYEMVLEEVAFGLSPDVFVIAVFPFNDLSSDDYRANYQDAIGNSRATHRPWYQALYVYRAFLGRVEDRVRRMLALPSGGAATSSTPGADDARENLAALERIVDTIRRRNGKMIIVLLPNTDAFGEQHPLFAPFTDLCDRNDWRCVNLLDDFIASGVDPSSLRLNLLDAHPNERYHAIVAKALSRSVLPLIQDAGAN